jgi:glycerol-3-phosphate O-acyltransferase / dihydroxyacetone phosphate acyltransferase
MGNAFRVAVRLLFRRIVAIYFRDIEVAGDVPDEHTGGRLFAANHVNALVDPILVLTQAPCDISPVAKSTLWKIPGLRWLLDAVDAVPIIRRRDVPGKSEQDNEAVFARVAAHLIDRGNILIFPEGTSHNEPHLIALRSGAGRMLARAANERSELPRTANEGPSPLTFQAVALEFDARDVFRSRTLVLFGPARSVADLPGADVAREVTEALREDLSELLVEGATWDERVLIVHVAEMFANGARDRSLSERNRIGRRIEQARRVLASSDPDTLRSIEERVSAYFGRLEAEETNDAAVARVARGEDENLPPERLARAGAMIVTLPLALLATVLYFVPYQLPRFVTKQLKDDPDTSSTYKIGVGLVVYPAWVLLLGLVAFWRLPAPLAIAAMLIALACPFAALPWLDRWDRLAVRARMLAPSEERRDRLTALAAERAALVLDLDAARVQAETPHASAHVRRA